MVFDVSCSKLARTAVAVAVAIEVPTGDKFETFSLSPSRMCVLLKLVAPMGSADM